MMAKVKEDSKVLPLDQLEELVTIIDACERQQRQPEEELLQMGDKIDSEHGKQNICQQAEASGNAVEAAARHKDFPEKHEEEGKAETKIKDPEQLHGLYEHLRHSFLEEEGHGTDSKVCNVSSSIRTVKKLAGEVQAWGAGPRQRVDEQIAELKELRSGLASTALGFFQSEAEQCSQASQVSRIQLQQGTGEEVLIQDVSKRIELLVEELIKHQLEKSGQPSICTSTAPPALLSAPVGTATTGKRKLSEAFTGRRCSQPAAEHDFLKKKKAFLRGLHESFKKLRQREIVCMSLDKRLLSARLLLEQARRGCQSSDYVSMRSKRQVEQAYKELLQVQQEMERIRSSSSLGGSASPPVAESQTSSLPSGAEQEMVAELARLKQRAERAESLLAVERAEVDRLRGQLQGVSGRLRQEARSLSQCMRARQATVDKLRCQVQQLEERDAKLSSQLQAAVQQQEELSAEKDELVWRLCSQESDLDKLRRENVSMVAEKMAMEERSRSLQHKVDGLMTKVSQTKQQWSRFMVYL